MNIVACLKQVPDNAQILVDPATGTLKLEGVQRILNPFDEYALEEGLRIKEKHGGKVILLSMGPASALEVLREGLSRGADEAVLCCDPAFEYSDTNGTAKILAKAIEKIKAREGTVDMILVGKQTMDGDTGQVGSQLCVHLKLPGVMYVKKFEQIEGGGVTVHRMTEEGYDVLWCPLPGIFGTVKEINEPRLPTLKGKLKAKSAVISQWTLQDLGLAPDTVGAAGSAPQLVKNVPVPQRPAGKLLKGEAPALVEELVEELRGRRII